MIHQPELFPDRAPHVDHAQLDTILHWLANTGTWTTASELLKFLGKPDTEPNKRKLRKIAELAAGKIASGPGTPGYKLTSLCTPEDMLLIEGMRSQGKDMIRRYLQIKRHWHRINP